MNVQEIKKAVDEGKKVYWSNPSYKVIKDKIGQYLIKHDGGSAIGLTWSDDITLNGKEEDFHIEGDEPQKLKEGDSVIVIDDEVFKGMKGIINFVDHNDELADYDVVYVTFPITDKKC